VWSKYTHNPKKLYEYALTLRPVSFATVPPGFVAFRQDPDWPHGVVRYNKPLSRADIEHFDLAPLDPLDPINLLRNKELFIADVYAEFSEKDVVVFRTRYGGRKSLTWSTRPGVDYQVTFWDGDTPTGHIDFNDFEKAAWELYPGTPWRPYWERRISYAQRERLIEGKDF
jgi:hypothetical protein